MKLIFGLSFIVATSAFALETDNYLSWRHDLPDATEDLNLFIQKEIEDVLSSSKNKNLGCKQVTFKIADRFKTRTGMGGEVFVKWSTKYLPEKIYPSNDTYIEQSIYRKTPMLLLKHAAIAPNMQAGGIYFGVDKLSHFASTGRRYFKEFLNKMKKGFSVEEAENAAIDLGISNEAGILGLWASGVFSYGDLEANYQGLLFYRKFCLDEKDTYLEKVDGHWKLVKVPNVKDYVNPYWDETFYLTYSEERTWKVVSKILAEEYCPMRQNENVVSRFKLYEEVAKKSRSMLYIEELQASRYKQAPNPLEDQSFDQLCFTKGPM